MKSEFKYLISKIHSNFLGKKVNEKVVIIESDDWGSIRIPSKKTIDRLKLKGLDLSKNAYTRFDGLETNPDLELLLEILNKYKDRNGIHPIMTTNFVTCNPDFEQIRSSNFEKYFNKKITSTYHHFPNSDKVLDLVFYATSNGLFFPQFHGREHVNVEYWMSLLKSGDSIFKLAFEEGISGLGREVIPLKIKNTQATYDTLNADFAKESLIEGLNNFEEIFGFQSRSFIPNNFVLCPTLLPIIKKCGIDIIQGMKYLLVPNEGKEKRQRIFRNNGNVNEFDQLNLVRNCSYEPSESGSNHLSTLKEIKLAFLLNQPAVISSHRLNFTSRISVQNRDNNLRDFEMLIKSILKLWPDVSFLSSLQLAEMYRGTTNEK